MSYFYAWIKDVMFVSDPSSEDLTEQKSQNNENTENSLEVLEKQQNVWWAKGETFEEKK